ncbi:hypothetical protein BaRGS_00026010 [Batillaria attramentaria]|uniref:Uncharacterized protein n=1 Tax=Batillaria attramentaria TaxID=370345 RepID=A0ABD0K6I0_9CAEN
MYLCAAHAPVSGEIYHEERLLSKLLDNYYKDARPVSNPDHTVNVSIRFSFIRIEDLIESTDTFSATVFIVQTWRDPRLRWNASEYGGLQQIRLPRHKLWTPDIVLYNVASQGAPESRYEDMVVVTSDGSMIWIPMMTLYSTCPMDLTYFPYDTQTCTMVFGSWAHTSKEMSVKFLTTNESEVEVEVTDEDSMSFPIHQHPEWELVGRGAKAKITKKSYECCPDSFTILSVTVKMARKPQFYRYLTVGPAAVLGLLVPVLFLLPANAQEKSTYGLLLLLCLSILMLIMENAIPFTHGSLPHIASFYLGTMILTCFSIVLSVLITNISARGARRKALPAWIHTTDLDRVVSAKYGYGTPRLTKIFLGRLGLRRMLCMGDYSPVDNVYSYAPRSEDTLLEDTPMDGDVTNASSASTDIQLREIHRCVRFMMGKMAADDSYRNVSQEWVELAHVLDRCLFLAFFVFYIFTAVSLLL